MVLRFAQVIAASFFAAALQFYVVTSSPTKRISPWTLGGINVTEEEEGYVCERFNEPYCRCFNPASRNHGLFPNHRNQYAQDAKTEFGHFIRDENNVIRSNCSDKIGTLLCFMYFPFYDSKVLRQYASGDREDPRIFPCRELCEEVRRDCLDDFLDNGYEWPPHLNCSQDYFSPWWSGEICINGTDPAQGYDACVTEGSSYTTPGSMCEDKPPPGPEPQCDPKNCPSCSKLRRNCTARTFVRNGYTWAAHVKLNDTDIVNGTKAYFVEVIKQYLPDPEKEPRLEEYAVIQTTNPECCSDCPDDITVGDEYLFSGYHDVSDPVTWELDITNRGSLVSEWTSKYSARLAKWIAKGLATRQN